MDAATLREAMGRTLPLARYEQLCPAFNAAMTQAGCTTVNRAAMWCAQLGHESAGLRYMEEIASGAAYENRRDLGNTQPGDGKRFKGHGPIQITGRHNHSEVSKWAYSKGLVSSPTYFVDRPTELASDRYGFLGPVWYWTVARPRINAMCDAADLTGVTKAINGGTNGLTDRRNRWNTCLKLGNRLLPTNGGTASSGGTYTVRAGDTLSGIAARYPGVTWQALAAVNALADPDRLQLGQVLRIPSQPASATPVAPAASASQEDALPTPADVWQHPIDDPYTPQVGDTQPAHVILAFLGANAAHAANASRAALTELAALRSAVERLAGAVGTAQGIDPESLKAAVREAIADSVHVTGDLRLEPRT